VGKRLHSPCVVLAGEPEVSHLSTMRLQAVDSPRVAHTPESPAHPLWPLYLEAGSGNPLGGLWEDGGSAGSRAQASLPQSSSLASPSTHPILICLVPRPTL
jgi:hypothetical protein